ncbi:hypothetical protein [uncultured Paraglaciecola sp.]|uniref:hypothetical protein n=1 Tax=uncultured Paraglaciecola sp. TaxID=1765024 RepID=UPI0030DC662B|tara:strand:- start:3480 stop:4433 length:954 start_codon:yes stop_codon:yes gene_type:complete
MSESQDIQELRNVLLVAKKYFKDNRNTLKMAERLLSEMVDKSFEFIKHDIDIPDIRFTHEELFQLVWPKAKSPDKAPSTIRNYRPQLIDLLEDDSSLSQFMIKSGCEYLLDFNTDDVKGGAKTTHGLILKSSAQIQTHKASNVVSYKVVRLPKPTWWMKSLMKIELEGRNSFWFIFVAVLCVLSIALVPYFVFKGSASGLSAGLLLGVIIVVASSLLYKIYDLMERGVSKSPDIFTPFRIRNLFFVTTRKPKDESEATRPKVIELLAFEGRCGSCGDDLFIEKSREFKGRYVGRCAIAPQEHVFSFDHITKTGKCLR